MKSNNEIDFEKVINLHHIAIQTSDIEKAIRFYTDILGAELRKRNKFKKRQVAWLNVGEFNIELYSKREGEELEQWNDHYCGPVHLAFCVKDIDTFLKKALENGAQFHSSHPEPFIPQVPGAKRIAYLLGPDGEEVEIRSLGDES